MQVDSLHPGVLGASKASFALAYCEVGAFFATRRGFRSWELNLLLREAVMIRRYVSAGVIEVTR